MEATLTSVELTALVEKFDREIRFDAHPLGIKFGRSRARKEIRRIRRAALTQIGIHLEQNYLDKQLTAVDEDVFEGWKWMIAELLHTPPQGDTEDVKLWIAVCFSEGGPPDSSKAEEPAEIVHALLSGSPLCNFSNEVPANWPARHTFTSVQHTDEITCPGCKAAAQRT